MLLAPTLAVGVSFSSPPHHLRAWSNSRDWRNSSFTILRMARSSNQCPPFQAFRAALALPSGLRGPVDRSHGFQRWINAACRALRSGAQGVGMLVLQ